jgi:hypothetical protein
MDFGPVLRQNITTEMNITHECSSQDIWETKREEELGSHHLQIFKGTIPMT